MNPNQALWEKGDFTQIAASMRTSGERFIDQVGISPGHAVLDLGCGDGTTAIPAAQRGADVVGVDIARNLIEAGAQRAASMGLSNCRFQHGDASDLRGVDDESFDVTVSVFGAMFAPRPFDVAREMVRVTRPNGRIVMGNWIPGDPTLVAQILQVSSAYSPPPPEGFVSPMTWGQEEHVNERFAKAGVPPGGINCSKSTFTFEYLGSPSDYVSAFRRYYGPTMNAFEAADASGRADELHRELEDLFESHNVSTDPDTTTIEATFLRVEVDLSG
jgi:SAM-dependent methyltransferase